MPIACRRYVMILVCSLLILISSELHAEPRRVIALAPHVTELVYAVDAQDQLVGVVEYSDYPPAATSLPRIGDAFRFDLETILSLEANLALAWRGGTPIAVVNSLQRLGIQVEWIKTETLSDVPFALRQLSEMLDTQPIGHRVALDFEKNLSQLRETFSVNQPLVSVFYQVSRRPLYTLGRDHILNQALQVCAMRNVFDELEVEAAVVSQEAVIDANPELFLAAQADIDPFSDWRQSKLERLIDARFHQIDPDLLIRPGPRILIGIERLCRLHPEAP